MKIALLGYGKMGHEIEKAAIGSGHSIHLILDNESDWNSKSSFLTECDVAIEFSVPSTVIQNISRCIESGIPVVVGTTGWYDQLPFVTGLCNSNNGTLFYASNFSIGVNIFFEINRKLASLLQAYPSYSPAITEVHHTQKLDSPSGTAITLANEIIASNSRYTGFTDTNSSSDKVPVTSIREGTVTGKHTITWSSEVDQITISHDARNRQGFAFGAVMAAEWVKNRKGVFTMSDLMNP